MRRLSGSILFDLAEAEEGAHPLYILQPHRSARDPLLLLGETRFTDLVGPSYLLLQRAHGFIGPLLELPLATPGALDLGVQLRLPRSGGPFKILDPYPGGRERAVHDAARALPRHIRRQVVDDPDRPLAGKASALLFFRLLPAGLLPAGLLPAGLLPCRLLSCRLPLTG